MEESIATKVVSTSYSDNVVENIIKTVKNRRSEQIGETELQNIREPDKDFDVYDIIYEGSYIVAGIVDKTSFAINTGFDVSNEELKLFLDELDILVFAKNIMSYGNLFLEIVRNAKGDITEINPIITNTMAMIKGGGFIQRVGMEKVYFNAFTPFENQKAAEKIWERTRAGQDELAYDETTKTNGFNPNLNECYLVKIPDIKQKRYGISFFDPVLNQIILLKYIDEYYSKYFEQGNVQQKVFYSEKALNHKDRNAFVERLRQEAKGIKNAHQTFLLESPLNFLNLTDELNTTAFLDYRRELQKSIAMRLNMPYDLLDTTSSNKASSLTAIQAFNEYTVLPIQKIILDAIKHIIADDERYNEEDINQIKFNNLNTKDRNIESDTVKNLYEQGMITLNEARERMNFKPLPDGDKLKAQSKATFELGKDDIDTISKVKDLIKQEYDAKST